MLYIKQNRDSFVDELMRCYPNAFLLITQIARRARREETTSLDGVRQGEAKIGDLNSLRFTEMQYRHAKKQLKELGLVEFRSNNKGTFAKLANNMVYDVNISHEQNNDQATSKDDHSVMDTGEDEVVRNDQRNEQGTTKTTTRGTSSATTRGTSKKNAKITTTEGKEMDVSPAGTTKTTGSATTTATTTATTNKNYKELKELSFSREKNKILKCIDPKILDKVEPLIDDQEFQENWKAYLEVRKSKKAPLTDLAYKRHFNKIIRVSNGDMIIARYLVDKAQNKGHTDIYDLNDWDQREVERIRNDASPQKKVIAKRTLHPDLQ